MMTCFYTHQPNLNITDTPLQAAVAKKIRFPIPQLPVKGYGVFLRGTGYQHFSCFHLNALTTVPCCRGYIPGEMKPESQESIHPLVISWSGELYKSYGRLRILGSQSSSHQLVCIPGKGLTINWNRLWSNLCLRTLSIIIELSASNWRNLTAGCNTKRSSQHIRERYNQKVHCWMSLVEEWIRIHLPMQETWVRSLVQEDPITEPMLCNKRNHSKAKPVHHSRVAPARCNWRKPTHSNEDPVQPEMKKNSFLKSTLLTTEWRHNLRAMPHGYQH